MLVHPGRGGQQMLSEHLEKVRQLRGWIDEGGFDVALEVDGGVKTHNAASCVEAGVDIIVAGSAVYNDRETPQRSLAALRGAIPVAQAPVPRAVTDSHDWVPRLGATTGHRDWARAERVSV